MGLKKIAILVILSVVFLLARQAKAFGISPVRTVVTVDPGTSQVVSVEIKNDSTDNATFISKILGAIQDEKGRPVFGTGIEVAENWVVTESAKVDIDSGKSKTVIFFVRVPADATPGSHYLGLAIVPAVPKQDKISLNTELISLLTVQVSGVVREKVSINNWKVENKLPDNQGWVFKLGLVNNGNVEVPLSGSVTIKNLQGKIVFSNVIDLGNNFLAGSSRNLKPEIAFKTTWPGLYKVQVKVNYGKTNQTILSVYDLWYFPLWSQIFLLFLVLVSFILFRFLRIRSKNRL